MKKSNLARTIILAGSFLLQLSTLCFQSRGAANDDFANAQVISGSAGTTTGNNSGATKEPGEPDHAGVPGGSSVWFRWTAPASGRFSFNTIGSSFDTLLAAYTGAAVNALTEVASNDDYGFEVTSEVTIPATVGTTYYVAVGGYDNETGTVVLNWALDVPPINDNFANATVISGPSGSVGGSNSGATKEPGEPDHAGEPGGRSVWFRWTAPASGPFSFNTAGSAVDTLLAVYTGASVNALTAIATNDNVDGGYTSSVSFPATAGTTYFLAVDGYYSHGALVFTWAVVTNDVSGVPAFTFTTLHSFTNGSDGAGPQAELIVSGNTLYGTTVSGGSSGNGTVFKVNTDGTGYTNLHSFNYTGGSAPFAGLILSSNTLYGTTRAGGSSGYGTVFAISTNGTAFTNLYKFTAAPGSPATNSDGALPHARLILSSSGKTLYGVATSGGRWGNGTVFALNTDGTGFTNLYSFTASSGTPGTNIDGANPSAELILSGNTLYGTASGGGRSGYGTVFALNTNGMGFTTLHHFSWTSDGAYPRTAILSGNTLYGTGHAGGNTGHGVVFAVNTDGTGFTNLYRFSEGFGPMNTNRYGSGPFSGLILSGNTLYGAALGGGSGGIGTLFALNTNGTGLTSLYSFTSLSGTAFNSTNSDGARPRARLVFSGNTLYGTADRGGTSGYGTVFSLSLSPRPHLTIIPSGPNVILTWPTNAAGFTLQSTTNLVTPAVWSTNSPAPVVVNGQNTVTNPASGTQKSFRLKSQ